jgi:hypothetical protein
MSGTVSRRLAGIAVMTIDGEPWDVVSDLVWSASSITRETMRGQSGVEGYSEMPNPNFISATLRDRSDMSVAALNTLTNASVVVQQANGKTVAGDNMWATEVGEVRTQEGTFTIRFEGRVVTETPSAAAFA